MSAPIGYPNIYTLGTFIPSNLHRMRHFQLDYEEQAFVNRLVALPLHSILDRGEGENTCWRIGQEIYDKYRNEDPYNALAGKEAVQKICDAIEFNCADGKERKMCIERAWDEIGDNAWSWRK
jgi:hypothetical protein